MLELRKLGTKWSIFDTESESASIFTDIYLTPEGLLCMEQAPRFNIELTHDEIVLIRPLVTYYQRYHKLPESIDDLEGVPSVE